MSQMLTLFNEKYEIVPINDANDNINLNDTEYLKIKKDNSPMK